MPSLEITKSARRHLKNDQRFKRMQQAFDTLDYLNLDVVPLEEEILFLHNTRPMRTLKDETTGTHQYTQKLIDSLMTDQAIRSRLTEIIIACVSADRNISDMCKAYKDYAVIKYSDILKSWRTKEERRQFLDVILRPFLSYQDDVQSLQIKAELVIQDIDKAGFALKNNIQALEMITRPERNTL